MRNKINSGFSKKDIGVCLNNALVLVKNPNSLRPSMSELRIKGLKQYLKELLSPVIQHLDDNMLYPEEVVFMFVCAALYIQAYYIMETDKLPMAIGIKELFNKKVFEKLPLIDVKCPKCKHQFEI
jgi:hypothetical protein